jgi:hypothetical protein
MSQVLRYSPDGQFWWNGQQWLPVPPPPQDFVPIQSRPSSSGVNWNIIGILLGIVGLAAVVALYVNGVRSFDHENRDFQSAYCQTYPNDPSC